MMSPCLCNRTFSTLLFPALYCLAPSSCLQHYCPTYPPASSIIALPTLLPPALLPYPPSCFQHYIALPHPPAFSTIALPTLLPPALYTSLSCLPHYCLAQLDCFTIDSTIVDFVTYIHLHNKFHCSDRATRSKVPRSAADCI